MINPKKLGVMKLNQNKRRKEDNLIIKLEDNNYIEIPYTSEYKYLGIIIN